VEGIALTLELIALVSIYLLIKRGELL
jgi:hypothetical protein